MNQIITRYTIAEKLPNEGQEVIIWLSNGESCTGYFSQGSFFAYAMTQWRVDNNLMWWSAVKGDNQ